MSQTGRQVIIIIIAVSPSFTWFIARASWILIECGKDKEGRTEIPRRVLWKGSLPNPKAGKTAQARVAVLRRLIKPKHFFCWFWLTRARRSVNDNLQLTLAGMRPSLLGFFIFCMFLMFLVALVAAVPRTWTLLTWSPKNIFTPESVLRVQAVGGEGGTKRQVEDACGRFAQYDMNQ